MEVSGKSDEYIPHEPDDRLLEPLRYLRDGPAGKELRGTLIDCFQQWLRINESKIAVIKDIIASLHTSSLLVDDIEDSSKLRRGVPVAHAIYGVPSTINCANYVYFLALEKCYELKSSKAMHIFVKEMLNLHRGQGQDIMWRDTYMCPSEEDYKQMVIDKTGGLFRLSVGLMQAFSDDQSTDFTPLLNYFALYFQIRDDLLNICNAQYMQGKSFCEDISEGKFSFPIIHAIHEKPTDSRLLSILRQRTEDIDVKKHAVQWMESCGSIAYTRASLKDIKAQLLVEINKLGGHDRLVALIEFLDSQL